MFEYQYTMTIQSIEADNSENIPNCNNKKKNKLKNVLQFQSCIHNLILHTVSKGN